MSTTENGTVDAPRGAKRCFVVSEFGRTEEVRRERAQTLKHLVKKVLEPKGYKVQRADEIDDPGQITHQVIEHLLDDELVVADLTGLNPNVFYELAVRHAVRKPVITLMVHGETLPFDLKDVRTVFYDLHDPDKLETAQTELGQKVDAIEAHPSEIRNPITVTRDAAVLQQSADPEIQAAGAVLAAVNELRDEMRGLMRRSADAENPTLRRPMLTRREAERSIREIFAAGVKAATAKDIADIAGAPVEWTSDFLRELAEEDSPDVFLVNGKWSSIPF
jgi:hypothetical protein